MAEFRMKHNRIGVLTSDSMMFQRGEYNKLRLANKAITEFEAHLPA